jgi:hypothetical protein
MALLKPLLKREGVSVAGTGFGAVCGTVAALAGAVLTTRGALSVSANSVDLCWSTTRGLIATDFVNGAHVAAQGLRLALALGDDHRTCRAMAVVGATILGPIGGSLGARGMTLLAQAEAIARRLEDPYLLGTIEVLLGQLRLVRGDFLEAFRRSVSGGRMLRPFHATFERNVGRMGALRAAEELGDYDYVRARAFAYLNEARETGDRYAEATFALSAALASLASDDPSLAEDVLRRAMDGWGSTHVYIQHLYLTRALVLRCLYSGETRRARSLITDLWPGLERSQLLRVPVARIDALSLRARVGLAAADDGEESMLPTVERDLNQLERLERNDAQGWVFLLRGALASRRLDRHPALDCFARAATTFERSAMMGMSWCARLRFAQIAGDAAEATTSSHALDALGVARPDRWLLAYAPGGISRKAR